MPNLFGGPSLELGIEKRAFGMKVSKMALIIHIWVMKHLKSLIGKMMVSRMLVHLSFCLAFVRYQLVPGFRGTTAFHQLFQEK